MPGYALVVEAIVKSTLPLRLGFIEEIFKCMKEQKLLEFR
jgi:hypothetical protein